MLTYFILVGTAFTLMEVTDWKSSSKLATFIKTLAFILLLADFGILLLLALPLAGGFLYNIQHVQLAVPVQVVK